MNNTNHRNNDGYTVDVALLKPKPVWLLLVVVALVAVVVLPEWLGMSARPSFHGVITRNDAANQDLLTSLPIPNNATSAAVMPSENGREDKVADDRSAISESSRTDEETLQTGGEPKVSEPTHSKQPAYTVQLALYTNASEANELVSRVRASGYQAHVASVDRGKKATWYRVNSGRFETQEEAAQHERKLRASGSVDDTMVEKLQ
jgi:cell division septation protein DedD